MTRIPAEKHLTREQLQKKVNRFRFLTRLFNNKMNTLKHPAGTEMFLNTNAGRVRVLAYNMENQDRLPLYINMHGSGFVMGHAEMDDPFMMNIALNANVKILNIDYSLSPDAMFPAALEECYAVCIYAKEHPEELGIDPEKIAVGGHSAGGNLGAVICLKEAEKSALGLKALILDYPPLDIDTDPYLKPRPKGCIPPGMARMFNAAYRRQEEGRNPLVSPVFAPPEQLREFPPTLVITAGRDSLAAEAGAFKDMLQQAGVTVTYRCFEDCLHGFTLAKSPHAEEAWRMMIDHLKKHLHPKAQ